MATLLVSAGDASGELYAADFAAAFQKRNPGSRVVGVGADAMRRAGVEIVADQRDLAIGGLLEVVGGLRGVARAWRAVGAALSRERPDLVVLVDSAGFNLPLARRVRRRLGPVPILYYVAPQVWAWRTGRIRKLARRVDRVAVLFPFEPEVYAGSGVRVDFVGHPLVDAIPRPVTESEAREARERCGVPDDARVVALMPGSRRNEIAAHLDLQLDTARRLHAEGRVSHFVLAVAPSLDAGVQARLRAACDARPELPLRVLPGAARDAIAAADVVLAKPGTVTMECCLMGRPMVVMGRAHPLTAWVARRMIRVPSLTMPNLIAGEAIVPELLQQGAEPESLARAVAELLEGPAREAQLAALREVRGALGPPGATERACLVAEEMLASAGP